ncbi:MAG: outer membrane lipoprotein carrier protein LolA [Gammaproteobacteria bacterium]|jgi:outer membrane lipoprotein carrier protein|nr:outer membrane lipoprotein carrier protein LolA [Gammaproteobacteria bacterium]|tara:strand:- start:696 stop:1328 length:633 start_codon:yes stop_codon:yes gene_type:complete
MRHLTRFAFSFSLLVTLPLYGDEAIVYSELLSGYLSNISTLSGSFEQHSMEHSEQHSAVYSGALWLAKPNHFRLDTAAPSLQSLVSDGVNFWSYDEDLEQVIISKLNENLNQVPILLFSADVGRIEDTYHISGYEDEEGEHFLLQPVTDASLFRSLTLEFKGGVPASIKVRAANGQATIYNLNQVVINGQIPAGKFSFTAPEHVDVIDDR